MKLSQIAEILNCPFTGEDREISGVNTLEVANQSEISFLSNPKYARDLEKSNAGVIILKEEFSHRVPSAIITENPYEVFARCIFIFSKKQGFFTGISEQAYIDKSAKIGKNCTIYPFVTVGANAVIGDNTTLFSGVYIGEDALIGNNCILYPNSVVMSECILGDECCLQPGAVIGAEGFGFIRNKEEVIKIPQIGKTILKNKVEVGANSCIDRAALDKTEVGTASCIDNLVQLGHNVIVGDRTFIVALTGIAGSTKIGNDTTIAAHVGISGHLNIGNNVTIAAKSGVAQNIEDNAVMGGVPATNYRNFMKTLSLMPRFPEIFKRLTRIEKELKLDEDN